jgi:hypothetical protein
MHIEGGLQEQWTARAVDCKSSSKHRDFVVQRQGLFFTHSEMNAVLPTKKTASQRSVSYLIRLPDEGDSVQRATLCASLSCYCASLSCN